MIAASHHLLVGRPDAGKTTLLLKVAQRLGGVRVAGFFALEKLILLTSPVRVSLRFERSPN
jgi:nucleoside-triphosphatase THEP1